MKKLKIGDYCLFKSISTIKMGNEKWATTIITNKGRIISIDKDLFKIQHLDKDSQFYTVRWNITKIFIPNKIKVI